MSNNRTRERHGHRDISGLKHEPKLTVEQVDEIRARYRHHSRDANCRVLADEFGVSITTIHKVVREKNWKFPGDLFRVRCLEKRNINNKFISETAASLRGLADSLINIAPDDEDIQSLRRRIYERYGHQHREDADEELQNGEF